MRLSLLKLLLQQQQKNAFTPAGRLGRAVLLQSIIKV